MIIMNIVWLIAIADFYKTYEFSPIEHRRLHENLFFVNLAADLRQTSALFLKMLADDEAKCRFEDNGMFCKQYCKDTVTVMFYAFHK